MQTLATLDGSGGLDPAPGHEMPWWTAFCEIKDAALAVGAVLGLLAAMVGKPRRYGLIAVAAAALAFLTLTFK